MSWKYWVGGAALVVVAGVAWYGLSPLFITLKVDDPMPAVETVDLAAPVDESGVGTAPVVIVDTAAHPASGTVRVVEADGKRYVRYENYKTINGPDIYVYLAKDLDAKEFVNLGRVRGTEGNVNYEIPDGVDPREYPYVLTWCKVFGVLFNSAKVY